MSCCRHTSCLLLSPLLALNADGCSNPAPESTLTSIPPRGPLPPASAPPQPDTLSLATVAASALNAQLTSFFADTKYGGSGWQEWFALMYSVYSFPNVILPFIGGFLVDFLGVRLMLVVFNLFILGGQLLFAFGISLKVRWRVFDLGRELDECLGSLASWLR